MDQRFYWSNYQYSEYQQKCIQVKFVLLQVLRKQDEEVEINNQHVEDNPDELIRHLFQKQGLAVIYDDQEKIKYRPEEDVVEDRIFEKAVKCCLKI